MKTRLFLPLIAVSLSLNAATPVVPWAIVTPPQSQIAHVGSAVEFHIATEGELPTSYAWRKSNVTIRGANSDSYSFVATLASAGTYNVVTGGKLISPPASLVVMESIKFVNHVAEKSNAVLTATVKGLGATYQWTQNGVPLVDGPHFAGTHTSRLTIKAVTMADEASYGCELSAFGHVEVFDPVALDVVRKPVVTAPPPDAGVVTQPFVWELTADDVVSSWEVSGLPAGLVVNRTTGVVSGIPLAGKATPYTVKIIARNAAGASTPVSFPLSVQPLQSEVVGVWVGLLESGESNRELGGSIGLTLPTTGNVTGTLKIGAVRYPLKARATYLPGSVPTITFQVARPDSPYEFTLNYNSDFARFEGSVEGAGVMLYRAFVQPGSVGHVFAANLYLPQGYIGMSGVPQGRGSLTARTASNGVVTITGRLGDGSAISGAYRCSADLVPFYQPLYAGGGSVQSWLSAFWTQCPLSSECFVGSWFRGTLRWTKLGPTGFTVNGMDMGGGFIF